MVASQQGKRRIPFEVSMKRKGVIFQPQALKGCSLHELFGFRRPTGQAGGKLLSFFNAIVGLPHCHMILS